MSSEIASRLNEAEQAIFAASINGADQLVINALSLLLDALKEMNAELRHASRS